MALVSSPIDELNPLILESDRPDLKMTERAAMMPLPDYDGVRKLNNFNSGMKRIGDPIYKIVTSKFDPSYSEQKLVGIRPFDDAELKTLLRLGGRGVAGVTKLIEQSEAEVLPSIVDAAKLTTNACREAFIRMWILCPKLTLGLMERCPQRDMRGLGITEELFVAYNIMSQLVDAGDRGVRDANTGKIDDWRLCR